MFHDVSQNSDEWLDLRAGKITGSAIGKIMANYGKAFGEPAKKLAVNIAVEQLTGKRIESGYSNDHMQRGHEQEPVARQLYEDEYFCDVTNGGFFDNGDFGCSPDGLVGDDGVIEIKSVIAPVQYATLKRGDVDPSYKWQIAFNLYQTGRDYIDYISYCADFPEGNQLVVYRRDRDDYAEQQDMITARTAQFTDLVNSIKSDIQAAA